MEHNLLPKEQMALKKGQRGCLDALAIDSAEAKETQTFKKSLLTIWIDYQKAFDMVPHAWLKRVLKIIKIPKQVRRVIKKLIPGCEATDDARKGHHTH